MILEKYDFNSIHEFLSELIKDINNKGGVHLTTVLLDKSKGQIALLGTNKKLITSSLNHALKEILTLELNEGRKPDMDAVATVIKHDVRKEYLSKETIDEIKETTNLQELLDIFMTKH